MAVVFILALAAVGAVGVASVLRAVVVLPIVVDGSAVALAHIHQRAAVVAILVPVTAVPACARVPGVAEVRYVRLVRLLAAATTAGLRVAALRAAVSGEAVRLGEHLAAANAAAAAVDVVCVLRAVRRLVVARAVGTRARAGAGRDAAVVPVRERARHQRERQREDEQQGNKAFFHEISSSLHDGDGEHDVERVHVLAVGGVGRDFGEVFKRHAALGLDNGEARAVYGEPARAGGGAAVNF